MEREEHRRVFRAAAAGGRRRAQGPHSHPSCWRASRADRVDWIFPPNKLSNDPTKLSGGGPLEDLPERVVEVEGDEGAQGTDA